MSGMDGEEQHPLSVDQFRAELEVFSGPLDLLLHLIRQEEVDIFEVPLARITDRYLAAVRTMEFFDINVAAEFLVVAATLMEIKSRTLLPPDPTAQEEEEDDAGIELVRRLIEYKEFREAAEHLGERVRAQSEKFPRPRLRPTDEASEEPEPESLLEELVVWDLMEAFAQVVAQTRLAPSTRVIRSDVPLSVYMDEVLRTVRLSRGPVDFLDFFRDESTRPRIVGIFLSLLELYRRKLILVTELDGGLVISLRDPEEPIPQPESQEAVPDNRQPTTDNRQPTTDNAVTAEHEHEHEQEHEQEQEHEDDAGQGPPPPVR